MKQVIFTTVFLIMFIIGCDSNPVANNNNNTPAPTKDSLMFSIDSLILNDLIHSDNVAVFNMDIHLYDKLSIEFDSRTTDTNYTKFEIRVLMVH